MRRCGLCFLVIVTCFLPLGGQEQTGIHIVEFTNGNWFDGGKFQPHTWFSVNGLLRPNRPYKVDEAIDLNGMFVIPACGESHNHNAIGGNTRAIDSYLSAGILYVENPDNLPDSRHGDRINTPDGIDVIFSNGGLTSPGGHPIGLVKSNIARGSMKPQDGEGAFYYTIGSPAVLEQKWPALLATKPDFVKVYLVYSEEFEKRKDDTKYFSRRGLDPKLLPLIVQKAKTSGLRVVAHVESAADFHVAVSAGVNQIAHIPGFWPSDEARAEKIFERYRINEADARLAGERNIQVSTTLSEGLELIRDPKSKEFASSLLEVYRSNVSRLKKNNVQLLIGSDRFFFNSQTEGLELVRSKLMSGQEALNAWCKTTPQAIFPERRIGEIRDGYEANFLVLASDPLRDFDAVKEVKLRFKHGVEIKVQ
jgi:hypothetical protein